MIYSVIAYWLVGMSVGTYLAFARNMGPHGMWLGIISGLSVAAVLLGSRFLKLSKSTIAAHQSP